jgi:hypothetical protein
VRGLSQRPSRKRRARSLVDRRGRATITAPAATPPAVTTARAIRTALPVPGSTTPTEVERREGGVVDHSEHDQREGKRTHAGGAAGIAADDSDPHRVIEAAGRTRPIRAAPPLPVASARAEGRSSDLNNRAQPNALRAWASRTSIPAATSSSRSPREGGQEVVAKRRATTNARAIATQRPTPSQRSPNPAGHLNCLPRPILRTLRPRSRQLPRSAPPRGSKSPRR